MRNPRNHRANRLASKYWAKKITAAWQSSLQGILETCRLLSAAKDKLDHGQFEKMIDNELPFGPSTTQRLMKIGRDKRLTNPAHGPLLPPSWRTLYELTKLSDAEFYAMLADGRIRPDMERDEARPSIAVKVVEETQPTRVVSVPVTIVRETVVAPYYKPADPGSGSEAVPALTPDERLRAEEAKIMRGEIQRLVARARNGVAGGGDIVESASDDRDALLEEIFELEQLIASIKEALGEGPHESAAPANLRPPEMPEPPIEDEDDEIPETKH